LRTAAAIGARAFLFQGMICRNVPIEEEVEH
jgi:hypothetical protein